MYVELLRVDVNKHEHQEVLHILGNDRGYVLVVSELRNNSSYELIAMDILQVFNCGENIMQELLEMFKVVCFCTLLVVAASKLAQLCSLTKARGYICEEDCITSLQLKDVILSDKEVICMGSRQWDVNNVVNEPGHTLRIQLDVILLSSDPGIASQSWQVVFFNLMKCAALMASSTRNSVIILIIRVIVHKINSGCATYYLRRQLYMQVNAHSPAGNGGTIAVRKGTYTVIWNAIFEVVQRCHGTIAKSVIAESGALVSTHQAANYENTESAFLGVLSTVNLTALITSEGGALTTFKERLQPSLIHTVQMNGFRFSWFWVLKLVKLTFPTVFEMKLQVCVMRVLHWSSSFHILEDKDNLKEWDLSYPCYGMSHLLREDRMLFSKNSNTRRLSGMCRYLRLFSLISFNLL